MRSAGRGAQVGVEQRRAPARQAGGSPAVASLAMGVFFIDTCTGQVATQQQLVEAGIADASGDPPRPWHRIQAPSDATTCGTRR